MGEDKPKPSPFGTVLGWAPGDVPVYSSDYDSADEAMLPNRQAYTSTVDGIYMGVKWQCVEFARRWLYLNRGWTFGEVGMAHEIFRLRSFHDVRRQRTIPVHAFRNGSRRRPEPGALLVWEAEGEFERTGHVAVVVKVDEDVVRIAEQNLHHVPWPPGSRYARELRAKRSPSGEFWIECGFDDASILGWVIQTEDATDAEPREDLDPELLALVDQQAPSVGEPGRSWLNVANPDEAAFVEFMGGHLLSSEPQTQRLYYCISETAAEELERATSQLHALFMQATEMVLRDDSLLDRFRLPRCLWPKIHQSWNNRRNEMITGRFDFALRPDGLKVYEYNCDSAGCYMECGKVQGKWARHVGCRAGRDPGADLQRQLRDAWRRSGVDGVVHILQDEDPEETYHALFMQDAMEGAGIRTRLVRGVGELRWAGDGYVVDGDGTRIRWVWKTWAWETALDQIRAECGDDEEKLRDYVPGEPHSGPVRLVDVLLRSEVMVFEPLWTLVPSNKAILPVLWWLFPGHPYLLESDFEVTPGVEGKGYVTKPIVGRGGCNVTVVGAAESVLAETGGRFGEQNRVYQEFFALPEVGGYRVQPSTFSVGGVYAGAGIRISDSLVVTLESENVALRIVDDDAFRALRREP